MNSDDFASTLENASHAIRESYLKLSPEERRRRAQGHDDQFMLDVAADDAAMSVLEQTGLRIISEESGDNGRVSDLCIVIDPIDGSTNASRGVGPFGPSICVCDEAGPVSALVMNVASGAVYTASRGSGAFKDGYRLARAVRGSGLGVVATGDPCPAIEQYAWTRISGASAHDLCMVADGTYDGYVDCQNTQSIWDYIAAALIISEAGGVIQPLDEKPLFDLTSKEDRRIVAGMQQVDVDLLVEAAGGGLGCRADAQLTRSDSN